MTEYTAEQVKVMDEVDKFAIRKNLTPPWHTELYGLSRHYQIETKNNFTTVVLFDAERKYTGVGVAKRRVDDTRHKEVGFTIALWRAFESALANALRKRLAITSQGIGGYNEQRSDD